MIFDQTMTRQEVITNFWKLPFVFQEEIMEEVVKIYGFVPLHEFSTNEKVITYILSKLN